ncbi:MAG TPA: FAD:protein FMN transferase, partial [Ghiorsea sp.]|nr:FAD:protein FMN transferase [Ghiorsea sp.]
MLRFYAILLLMLMLSACQPQAQDVKESRFLLGTLVEFTIFTDDEDQALA